MKILDVPQSGSLAGQTSSRNRFGQYRRTRATPVNPNSPAQAATRSFLTNASQSWRTLSDAARAAWEAYAAEHPTVDSLGSATILTGHQMFNSVNVANQTAGVAVQTAVPTGVAPVMLTFTITPTTAVAIEVNTGETHADDVVLFFASPPQSPGRSFNGDYRLVKVSINPDADSPICSFTELIAKFGALHAGQKFFLRAYCLNGGNRGPLVQAVVTLT